MNDAHGTAATLAQIASAQATTLAYSDLWSIASVITLALIPVILLLDLRPAQAAPATKT